MCALLWAGLALAAVHSAECAGSSGATLPSLGDVFKDTGRYPFIALNLKL